MQVLHEIQPPKCTFILRSTMPYRRETTGGPSSLELEMEKAE